MSDYPTAAGERIGRTLGACHEDGIDGERRAYRLNLTIQGLTVPALVEWLHVEHGIRFGGRPRRALVVEAAQEVLDIPIPVRYGIGDAR